MEDRDDLVMSKGEPYDGITMYKALKAVEKSAMEPFADDAVREKKRKIVAELEVCGPVLSIPPIADLPRASVPGA